MKLRNSILALMIVCVGLFLNLPVARAGECDRMITPGASITNYRGNQTIALGWHLPSNCNDTINLMWSVPAGGWHQQELGQDVCIPYSRNCTSYLDFDVAKPYIFKVQSCRTRALAPSVCSPWSGVAHLLPYGPDTCIDGFVWREALATDHVCVSPGARQQARDENTQAGARRNPAGGPYGPDTCLVGFVWREATGDDHVCVPPQSRQQARDDNAHAQERKASGYQ
jgi:hypothetical protein